MQIWIANKDSSEVIQAGWDVSPGIYGDQEPHLYVTWTTDQYKKVCYNFDCEGYKQSSSSIVPGHKIGPVSEYNGTQREITLKIQKDANSGDWNLYFGNNGETLVGYWPKALFTTIADSAEQISIGGTVGFDDDDLSPPMGSGHFSTEGEKRAAYISEIQFADPNGDLYTPSDDSFELWADRKDCYDIDGIFAKTTIYLGGPGGCKTES